MGTAVSKPNPRWPEVKRFTGTNRKTTTPNPTYAALGTSRIHSFGMRGAHPVLPKFQNVARYGVGLSNPGLKK